MAQSVSHSFDCWFPTHTPCWSKKRKHNYQKKASSRNAIHSITFMNYVMKEYTNLSYMSCWAGVLFQRLNEMYIDNMPGTHSGTCHIETVPVIQNGLGVKHVHFPLLPSVCTSLVQSDTKWLLISAMCHMGKKLALNLSFINLTRLNHCPYLYTIIKWGFCVPQTPQLCLLTLPQTQNVSSEKPILGRYVTLSICSRICLQTVFWLYCMKSNVCENWGTINSIVSEI